MIQDSASPEEIQKAVNLLKSFEPGKVPLPIFVEMARLTVYSILELVPLRKNKQGSIEVLLLERDPDDPVWGGLLHTPGTVIRPNDTPYDYKSAFDRLLKDELSGVSVIREPMFVEVTFHPTKRGMEMAQVYWVEVGENNSSGVFYEIAQLPENTVDSQIDFIKKAAEAFKNSL